MSPPNVTLTQLRHFLDVAAGATLREAAARHRVTRPAVSKSLLSLEKELSLRLLEHRKGVATLTPAGRRFAEALAPVMQELDGVLQARRGETRPFRLGLPYSVFRALVQTPLARVLDGSEGAQVEISFGGSSALLARLAADELDVALAVNPDKVSSHQRLPLWRGSFVLARRKGSAANALFTTENRPEVLKLLEKFPKRRRLILESWCACLDLAQEGSGSAFVPDFLVKGQNAGLKIEKTGQPYAIDAFWKKGKRPPVLWDELLARLG